MQKSMGTLTQILNQTVEFAQKWSLKRYSELHDE